MLGSLVFLIAARPGLQSPQKHPVVKPPPAAVIEVCNKIAESYAWLIFDEGERTAEKATTFSADLLQLAQKDGATYKDFAGASASEFQADIEAYADITKDYGAAASKLSQSGNAGDDTSAVEGLKTVFAAAGEKTRQSNRLTKAIDAISNIVRDHGSPEFRNSISPVAYYILVGPILLTPDYEGRTVLLGTFAPDPDLRSTATLLRHVVTAEDYARWQSAVTDWGQKIKAKREAGQDVSADISATPMPPQFSSIRPGDTIFALRKSDDQPWKKVRNWRDVSTFAKGLNVNPPTKIEALIGNDEDSAKEFEVLVW